ncbi:hypothetical protein [Calothrix sp. CCY 0018]
MLDANIALPGMDNAYCCVDNKMVERSRNIPIEEIISFIHRVKRKK